MEWVKFLDLEHLQLNYSQKFPMPTVPHFLMYIPDDRFQHHVKLSLDAIVNRGLYDHLDGGFFRYCVDKEWHIPHFEKMLYDNAQLISLLSRYDLLRSNNRYKYPVFDTLLSYIRIFILPYLPHQLTQIILKERKILYLFSRRNFEELFKSRARVLSNLFHFISQ